MVETAGTADLDKKASSARFRKLPERIRPEDMIASQETEPPPDPTMGRDPERDFMLRNAGF
ncbi:MAG: heme biosynthesis protein HemY [Phycicoccus sp.]|nr:heme biosynthesis protein HemY [Phycicoccus sp.]NMM35336.1 heme biosynthesis protein HemY [Phycicoccus sp.]